MHQPVEPLLTPMDIVRSALFSALEDGQTLEDVCRMAEYAETTWDFDHAVNELSETMPRDITVLVMFPF